MADRVNKKGVIKSVTPKTYNNEHSKDKKGNFQHFVEMEDGLKGIWGTEDKEAKALVVGKEIEYELFVWTSTDGSETGTKSINFLSFPKTPYSKGGGFKPKGAQGYKADAIMVAATNAANTIAMKDSLTEKDFPIYLKAYLKVMYIEIENLFK